MHPYQVRLDARVEAHPSTDYSVAMAIEDAAPEEARGLLLQQNFPGQLAERVVELVGGRLSHLQEAISYYVESPRWLSPMRPGATQEDFNAAVAAHFAGVFIASDPLPNNVGAVALLALAEISLKA